MTRDACMAVGSEQQSVPDGVMEIMNASHDYFAPDALNSVNQEVARFLHLKRAAQGRFGPLRPTQNRIAFRSAPARI